MSYHTKVGLLALIVALPRTGTAQDTLRLRADNAPVWGPSVPLVRVFRIGSVEGPPEYAFGRIRSVATRGDQSVFVYDEQDVQIRLYDAAGKFVKAVGRKGAGPGEYANVIGMAVVGDTMLVVGDYANGRVSYFNRDGAFVRTVAMKFASPNPRAFAIDAAGRIYVQTAGQGGSPTEEPPMFYVRANPDGKVLDSLAIPPRNVQLGFVVLDTPEGDRWNFMPTTISVVTPLGGIVSGRTEKFAIAMPVAGKPAMVERTHPPIPMTPAERTEWETFIRERDAVAQKQGRAVPSRPPIPDAKPPFRSIATDADGRVWIELYTTATKRAPVELPETATIRAQVTWREVATFDVLSPAGQYLGRVVLPQNSVLLAARGNRIWLRTEGPSGEHTLVAYRLGARGM